MARKRRDREPGYILANPAHHGAIPTAGAPESHGWTAYADVLGLRQPRGVDPRETLALRHPDAAVARPLLLEAMALRVAGWLAERAERPPRRTRRSSGSSARSSRPGDGRSTT